jgi:lipopolysaccharide export system permease protein
VTKDNPRMASSVKTGLNHQLNELENLISKIDYEYRNHRTYSRQVNSRSVEIHKKFSIPVACIVFMLIGAPLGVMTRKGGLATSIGLSLFFFIIYWAFLIGGEELADRMFMSGALSMWLPNIVIGIFGVYLTYVVNKRTTVEGMDLIMQLFSGSKK